MNGSEKQVKWAEDIINEAKEKMNRKFENAQARYNSMVENGHGGGVEEIFFNAIANTYELVKAEIDKMDSAKEIIDNRGMICRVALLKAVANDAVKAEFKNLAETKKFSTKEDLVKFFI